MNNESASGQESRASNQTMSMSYLEPKGPYPTLELDFWVRRGAAGVFGLSEDGRSMTYVGASERDVKTAIDEASKDVKPKWFMFRYTYSEEGLLRLTSIWYHVYNPPKNHEHPRLQVNGTRYTCPVPGCQYHK